jgi:hypothetical protein
VHPCPVQLGASPDLIVTMDDANNEHYSMFFVEEEGTASSFMGSSSTGRKLNTKLGISHSLPQK